MKDHDRKQLLERLAEGDLNLVFEYILENGLDQGYREFVLIKAHYERAVREYRHSAISFEEYNRELNKIKIGLLDWMDREAAAPTQPPKAPEQAPAPAPTPEQQSPAPVARTAKLLVQRESSFASSLREMGVYVDGEKVGTVANGKNAEFWIPAGRSSITVKVAGFSSDPVYVDIGEHQRQSVVAGAAMLNPKPSLRLG
jgi:hypothetical protein